MLDDTKKRGAGARLRQMSRKPPALAIPPAAPVQAHFFLRMGRFFRIAPCKMNNSPLSQRAQIIKHEVRKMDDIFIKIVGVGGGGISAVNHMCSSGMGGVEFVAIDTDARSLSACKADYKLNIAEDPAEQPGTGGSPETGEKAARANRERIQTALRGAGLVIIVAGLGGGTGTGAAPVVAEIARGSAGIFLTIGMVTRPFAFEGAEPARRAQEGIDQLRERVNTLLLIPNERLRRILPGLTPANAFAAADETLGHAVQCLSDPLGIPCWVNLCFHDVLYLMKGPGIAFLGLGRASGKGCVESAMQQAAASALLEAPLADAQKMIVCFRVRPEIDRENIEIERIEKMLKKLDAGLEKETEIIWSVCHDEGMEEDAQITLIATDFAQAAGPRHDNRRLPPDHF